MRTFIALHIPCSAELENLFSDFRLNLKGAEVKYVELNNLHITLSFLGETNASQATDLCSFLQDIKLPKHCIDVQLQSVGTFRNGAVPGSIWVGVEAGDSLQVLFQEISNIVALQGFVVDNRKFSPHITMGRFKKVLINNNIEELKAKYQQVSFGRLQITEFTYYQSFLTPQGPVYKPIQRVPL